MPDGLTFLCWAVGALVLLYILKGVVLFVLLVAGIWATAQEKRRCMDIWTAALIGIAFAVVLALLLWE